MEHTRAFDDKLGMAEKLTDEQHEGYIDAFRYFDKDNSGYITTNELGKIMRALGQNPKEDDLQRMINSVDADGNGKMDIDEFVKLMISQNQFSMRSRDLKQAFHIFDRDHRGFFMSSELRNVFRRLEENIPEHEINEILQDERDGFERKIVFKEFVKLTKEGRCQIPDTNTSKEREDSHAPVNKKRFGSDKNRGKAE